ncbi:hypothetical protein K458DRAFT_407930 [Lentithecium fluviatile CBS 122367]|uniref:25S rRNA (uridine-N(3))-methyltransferase BMT5-like domain-containing protein n=1 Tax=Lentithecium fluviatile CBS 122367 TaxID=1168545 RepID=A0A6G1IN22_9PLEO|nr:hypothetical protein K458DRAFT_407930 [Lentithecium fluviatile CBS 122367]
MSKSKTKRAHRELKRDKARKLAANQRKALVAAKPSSKPSSAPPAKKQKLNPTSTTATPANQPARTHIQASQKHDVPFGVYDNILLVGEGDFSFTRSLAVEHGCANVTGTSFDTLEEVQQKYPSFGDIEEELGTLTPPVPLHYGVDATRLGSYKVLRGGDGEGGEGWDTIAFMFPHTGGLSTDVNRQVRANQALLVGFFKACLDVSDKKDKHRPKMGEKEERERKDAAPKKHRVPFLKPGGKAIVTLFEGEPYTLWNVRDLARHAGLKVLESFKFVWEDYPGYRHVRTLGAIEGGGGWKGEDRAARMYVFEKVGDESAARGQEKKKTKRVREDSDSESEEV